MPQLRADQQSAPVHVIGCGALVRELRAVLPEPSEHSTEPSIAEVTYLPAPLHNRPDRIVPAIQAALDARPSASHVFIAYGDCGTGGALDAAIDTWRQEGRSVERLPGDHCYEFFTGSVPFAALHERELGTFFLTDYLTRHFDLLVWQGLGLADHPELLPMYFGNYSKLVWLSQESNPDTLASLHEHATHAADRLGLAFEHRPTGVQPLHRAVDVAVSTVVSNNVRSAEQPSLGAR